MVVVGSRLPLALVGVLALGLGMSGCARHSADSDIAAGAGRRQGGLWRRGARQRAGIQPDRRRPRFLRHRPDRPLAGAQATLDKQAAWLNQYNRYTFTIEGHADERGTREYNFALGARRAGRRTTISPPRASRHRA